jgi:hypothetical protein
MQGCCQSAFAGIRALSTAWKLPRIRIVLQGGNLFRVGTPPRLQTNRPFPNHREY